MKNLRIFINGMYDMHLFTSFKGGTVDEIITAYQQHNKEKHPAIVGDREVEDMGKACLCPVSIVGTNVTTGKDFTVRRVGKMVHPDSKYCKGEKKALAEWREAVSSDPDIPRILATATDGHNP
jgi:hypothetical protein